MSLHVLTDQKRPQTKAAVVVSKKVDKSAVKRNRIRRRIYEVVRQSMPTLKHPAELVFTVYKAEAETAAQGELEAEVHSLLKKAKLL